jgi:hypothetical protein
MAETITPDSGGDCLDVRPAVDTVDLVQPFEKIRADAVIIIVLAAWSRDSFTGALDEKGQWVKKIWQAIFVVLPEAQGSRLLWNTVFFVIPSQDVAYVKGRVREILKSADDPLLQSFCVISEARGSTKEKLDLLDKMQQEVASWANFNYMGVFPDKLLNGEDFIG